MQYDPGAFGPQKQLAAMPIPPGKPYQVSRQYAIAKLRGTSTPSGDSQTRHPLELCSYLLVTLKNVTDLTFNSKEDNRRWHYYSRQIAYQSQELSPYLLMELKECKEKQDTQPHLKKRRDASRSLRKDSSVQESPRRDGSPPRTSDYFMALR